MEINSKIVMELTSEIQIELAKLLEGTDIAKNLTLEQNRELLNDLELSIIVEMSTELLENLSEAGQKQLEEEHFQGYNSLVLFLKQNTSPEAYGQAIAKAVHSVLGEFMQKTAA